MRPTDIKEAEPTQATALSKSNKGPAKLRRGRALLAAGALVMATPVSFVALGAAPATAQSNCAAGTWGSVYGWGDCRGSGRWQLKVSCTWGSSNTSPVLTGPGHIDVRCITGSARSASIIYL